MDLRGRRHGSLGPSSLRRPPPIGRSQSSVDLQRSMGNKNSSISPVARDVLKIFSYDNAVNTSEGESAPVVTLTVNTDAGKSEPSPPTSGRDSIDGCEREKLLKETLDITSERINEGFTEDEETAPPSLTHQKTTEDDSKGNERLRDQEQSRREDVEKELAIKSPISGSETQVQDINSAEKELQLRIDRLPLLVQGGVFSPETESIHDTIQVPLANFGAVFDNNDDLKNTKIVKINSKTHEAQGVKALATVENNNTANHWEGENSKTQHDGREPPNRWRVKELSLQKRKLEGKREKKRNEKIEKTYFV